MSSDSPASILFSSDGYELAVQNEISIPEGTRAILFAGSDGSTARVVLLDGYNRIVTVGAGTAGSHDGGIFSVQGVVSGTPVIVSQSTANNLNAKITGAGTAGSPDSGIVTVQGISAGFPINVLLKRATTSTLNNVAGSTSSVTLLAQNSNRINASIFNDSSAILYVKLGTTASTSSFTIRLLPYSYWEIPESYTGIIDGIWSNSTGYARVDELT
mgnify:CR=1 FL=1